MNRLTAYMLIMILASCINNNSRPGVETKKLTRAVSKIAISPFTLILSDSNYAYAYSVEYVLSEIALKIIFKGELEGDKDSVIYAKKLESTELLKHISEINIDSLKEYYINPCMQDGSQIFVEITNGGKKKQVQLSNYYHPEIGNAIELINRLSLRKYKIWYDKQMLTRELEDCNINDG